MCARLVRMASGREGSERKILTRHAQCRSLKAIIDHVNKDGLTALYLSCVGGHEKVVSLLLDHGANPDQAEKNFGVTPLIAAA